MRSTKRHILCVDDNDDTCFMLSTLLGQAGYEVRSASSITEGLRLAESEHFDLYILDSQIRGRNGLDLCRRIREFDRTTPIIFFYGAGPCIGPPARSRCGRAGLPGQAERP